jgi:hypothetical protein
VHRQNATQLPQGNLCLLEIEDYLIRQLLRSSNSMTLKIYVMARRPLLGLPFEKNTADNLFLLVKASHRSWLTSASSPALL